MPAPGMSPLVPHPSTATLPFGPGCGRRSGAGPPREPQGCSSPASKVAADALAEHSAPRLQMRLADFGDRNTRLLLTGSTASEQAC